MNILIAAGKNIDPELYPKLIQGDRHIKDLASWYATMERSFSVMNRILSWARNSLDSSLASDFMLLSMNKDPLKRINMDKILDRWVNQKSRIVQFK